MRILCVTNLYPNPYHLGRATFNRQQFRALAESHEVRVISPISWTDELAARLRGASALPAGRQVAFDGMTIDHPRSLYTPKIGRRFYGRWYRQSIRRTFDRAVDEMRPGVVFAPWLYPDGWAALELGHARGLPVVLKAHGCDVLASGYGLDRDPSRRESTVDAVRRAEAIVAVSEHLAANLLKLGADPARVHVVQDGIDLERFGPGSQSDALARLSLAGQPPIILFVGSLLSVKGVDVLVDACRLLAAQRVDFRCCMVGDGPLRPLLEQRIAEWGLQQHVNLVGHCPHDRLADWFRAAAVAVLPSRSEGLPCVLLEASACGTPFVGSDVGGIPEIARLGTNWLVPYGDAAALASALAEGLQWSSRNPVRTPWYARTHADAARQLSDIFDSAIHTFHGRDAAATRTPNADREVRVALSS
ncbi:MAG TPA: glycosyltransferase [Tepidisphaeraceae bacterium]|jgi:glycosyltransferase involved in cell wall biosynthesis